VLVYRLYNASTGGHLFTTDANERATVIGRGWVDERVGFVAWPANAAKTGCTVAGTIPVYRFYNGNTWSHFYTSSAQEKDDVIRLYVVTSGNPTPAKPYTFEKVAFCVLPN
jgi:hypothetical protein